MFKIFNIYIYIYIYNAKDLISETSFRIQFKYKRNK